MRRLKGEAEEESADRERAEAWQAALDGKARAASRERGRVSQEGAERGERRQRQTYAEPGVPAAAAPVVEFEEVPGLAWAVDVVWTIRPSIV